MRTVMATFQSVFPHVEVWQTEVGNLVLLGSLAPPSYSVPALRSRLAAEPFASAMADAWHTAGMEGLLSHYVGGPRLVEHFLAGGPVVVNTDDHNAIEYDFARALGHTGWDPAAVLYRGSVALGDQRPATCGGDVDWDAVTRGRQWDAAVRGERQLSADDLALEEGTYDRVLERYLAKDDRGMLIAWQTLPHLSPCLTEMAVMAELYAMLGTRRAEPLIERIAPRLPAEADALRGILAWRQGNLAEAGRRLEAALLRLRSDPWMLEPVRQKTFSAAVAVAAADRAQAARLLEALGQPLAVSYADENRRITAAVIAKRLRLATAAQLVETFEPCVPWTESFLTFRRDAYRDAGHRLAAEANRDLERFARDKANSVP
jgi:hypothetical protein